MKYFVFPPLFLMLLGFNFSCSELTPLDNLEVIDDTTDDVSGDLVSLSIITSPVKTLYFTGDSLEIEGISVNAEYEIGSKAVDVDQLVLAGFDTSIPGQIAVSVSFEGMAAGNFNLDIGVRINAADIATSSYIVKDVQYLIINGQIAGDYDTVLNVLNGDWADLEKKFYKAIYILIEDHSGKVPKRAFQNLRDLETFLAPELTEIGDDAFQHFDSEHKLVEVNIPKVTVIGDNAFNNCNSLTEISLPEVISIGEWSFAGCSNLTIVDCPQLSIINSYAFMECALTILNAPMVTEIKKNALYNNDFTELVLPELTTMGESAVGNCEFLESVDCPKLEAVSYRGFAQCSSLVEVDLPEVTEIGLGGFSSCGFTTIDSTTFNLPKLSTLSQGVFRYCESLQRVELNNTITSMNSYVFESCTSLTFVALHGLEDSTYGTFSGCTSLATVILPKIRDFGSSYTFKNCDSLTTLVFDTTLINLNGSKFSSLPDSQSLNITLYLGDGNYDSNVDLDTMVFAYTTFNDIKRFDEYTQ